MRIGRVPTAVIYLALMPVAVIVGIFAEYLVISAVNVLPRGFFGEWMGIPLNLIPAAVAGFVVYRGPAERAHAAGPPGRWHGHFYRASPLYAGIGLFGVLFALGMREPGFGLVAQLVVWPLAAFVGGVFADLHARRDGPLHAPAA